MSEPKIDFTFGSNIILSYKRLSYTAWYALAEFVDNSFQSFSNSVLVNKDWPEGEKLEVSITYDNNEKVLRIKDNARGMSREELDRALQVGTPPPNPTGLSEYGMGMKTAACWFSNLWMVKSKAIGEDFATEAKFDIEKITKEKNDRLSYKTSKMNKNSHYTIVTLKDLNHNPRGKSVERIKDHLASMYRAFINKDEIEIRYNGALLRYKNLPVLKAPSYKDLDDEVIIKQLGEELTPVGRFGKPIEKVATPISAFMVETTPSLSLLAPRPCAYRATGAAPSRDAAGRVRRNSTHCSIGSAS